MKNNKPKPKPVTMWGRYSDGLLIDVYYSRKDAVAQALANTYEGWSWREIYEIHKVTVTPKAMEVRRGA